MKETIRKAILVKRKTEQIDRDEGEKPTFRHVSYRFLEALIDLKMPPERPPIWEIPKSQLEKYPILFFRGKFSIAALRCLVLIDEYWVNKDKPTTQKRRTIKTGLFYDLLKPLLSRYDLLAPEQLTSDKIEDQYTSLSSTLSQLIMLGVLGINYDSMRVKKDTDVEYRLEYPKFLKDYIADLKIAFDKLKGRYFMPLAPEYLNKVIQHKLKLGFKIPIIYLEKRGQYENALSISELFQLCVFATKGMSPTTFLCQLNDFLDEQYDHVLLVLSDYDPSGERDIPNSLKKRAKILGLPICEVKRIGIFRNQIEEKEYLEKRVLVPISKQKWINEKGLDIVEIKQYDKKLKKKVPKKYGYGLQMDALGEERLRDITAEAILEYLPQELYVNFIKKKQRDEFNPWNAIDDIAGRITRADPITIKYKRQITGIDSRTEELDGEREEKIIDITLVVESIEDNLLRLKEEYKEQIEKLNSVASDRTKDLNDRIEKLQETQHKTEEQLDGHEYNLQQRLKTITRTLANLEGYDDRECNNSMRAQVIKDNTEFKHGLKISDLFPKLKGDIGREFDHPSACPDCNRISWYTTNIDGQNIPYCNNCDKLIRKLVDYF